MRKAGVAVLLLAAACGNNDNVIYGPSIQATTITSNISFDTVNSVISGRASLTNTDGTPTGRSAEVVIISNQPRLCDRLVQHRDYFRNPPEAYVALILFLPPDDRLGTFIPGRGGDEGTASEIIGTDPTIAKASMDLTGKATSPYTAINGYGSISLRDWSESAGGETNGSFYLYYAPPPQLNSSSTFPFYATSFKATVCTTLDGTLLP